MKNYVLTSILFLITWSTFAQTEDGTSSSRTFEFVVVPKMGFARISQSNQPKLNGFVNGGDLLAAFKLKNNSFLTAGIGYNEFNANTTIAGESASLINTYLRIPVNYVTDISFSKQKANSDVITATIGIGLYANTLLTSELETTVGNTSEKNLGWNFGFSSYIGAKFKLTDTFNLGLGIETNSDFTKMKKDGLKQKIDNLTSLNLTLGFRFQ